MARVASDLIRRRGLPTWPTEDDGQFVSLQICPEPPLASIGERSAPGPPPINPARFLRLRLRAAPLPSGALTRGV
jgi:hypothetical protein